VVWYNDIISFWKKNEPINLVQSFSYEYVDDDGTVLIPWTHLDVVDQISGPKCTGRFTRLGIYRTSSAIYINGDDGSGTKCR
jgi:hypothetical protein